MRINQTFYPKNKEVFFLFYYVIAKRIPIDVNKMHFYLYFGIRIYNLLIYIFFVFKTNV